MPSFKKKALSLFMRSGCQRQLRFNLYSDQERRKFNLPPRQTQRAGAGLVGQMGFEWQAEKVAELSTVFGQGSVLQGVLDKAGRPAKIPLNKVIDGIKPYQFIVEAGYSSDTSFFRQAMQLNELRDEFGELLELGDNQPDLIQILPALHGLSLKEPEPYHLEVKPDGSLYKLNENDPRLRLRVIDIKLAAEPGAHYFAEVVYYALTLTGWLHENQLTNQFVVVAASAVWPGSYEASAVALARQKLLQQGQPLSLEVLASALEEDLELVPFETFVARLRRFFREGLPGLLNTPWQELPWHVDYSCGNCEFLGYPWQRKEGEKDYHEHWCWPMAEQSGHLSLVAGLSRGNAHQLGVAAVDDLAKLSQDAIVFQKSPTLRAQRTRFPGRARALLDHTAGLIIDSGSDAQMPRWPDLHIYLFLDYDLASAITATFGIRAFWSEPLPYGSTLDKQTKGWNTKTGTQEIFVVESRSLEREKEELLKFLTNIREILDDVRRFDERDIGTRRTNRSNYQIYLWDNAQRRHLQRVVGRHLASILANTKLRDLAWLFPPPELLANPDEASTRSPFTIVSQVVQNTVAVPLPHHYTLFGVAQLYHTENYTPPSIHPLYREPLSDLIPGERIHELWTKRKDWTATLQIIAETTRSKLLALGALVTQLERDLKDQLMGARLTAPVLGTPPSRIIGVPPMSLLLYEFTRLNAALQDLESYAIRSMPPHEREARFRSAYLTERLEGDDRYKALESLSQAAGTTLPVGPNLLVYRLGLNSRDLNARPGDIGFALSPLSVPGFLQNHPFNLTKDTPYTVVGPRANTVADAGLTSVSIVAIDRVNGLIALADDSTSYLKLKEGNNRTPYSLEQAGLVDLSKNVMLDGIEKDFFTGKLELTLRGMGYPQIAFDNTAMRQALGISTFTPPTTFGPPTPAAYFLWDGPRLAAETVTNDLASTRSVLEPLLLGKGRLLNESQWVAWAESLTHRLNLIWGPPGTGKSHTLQALIVGALLDADRRGVPLRLLVTASNYTALDNILSDLPLLLDKILPNQPIPVYRLQGKSTNRPNNTRGILLLPVATTQETQEQSNLKDQLASRKGLMIVGAIPHQIHNLAISTKNKKSPDKTVKARMTQQAWFDLVVIDEASQMDVAAATLVVSKAAENGAFVLAGDDLQLPPIHQADPPMDLERHVGSVFEYARHVQGVQPLPLNVNYRSNQILVEFTRTAGYDPRLHAYSPDLKLRLASLPTAMPEDWPATLAWSPVWSSFLNPDYPASAFVYEDDTSGQANEFEAEVVASLVWLLRNRMHRQLAGERKIDGTDHTLTNTLHDGDSFWGKGVGIVTPHKAQMSKIVGRLQHLFPSDNPEKIRAAVDTVERFQGQQRDVILASFGVGDPDLIRSEDAFLYSLRRFNVLASRARAKLIVLSPQSLIDHLSNDVDVLEESRLLKRYTESYCQPFDSPFIPYIVDGVRIEKKANLLQK